MSEEKPPKRGAGAMIAVGQAALTASLAPALEPRHTAFLFAVGVLGLSADAVRSFASPRLDAFHDAWAAWRSRRVPQVEETTEYPQAMVEAVRRLLEAPSAEVAAPLGRLVALYDGKPIDGFFRGTARLLGDVTPAELVRLRRLLRAALKFPTQDPVLLICISMSEENAVLLDTGVRNRAQQGVPSVHLVVRRARRLTGMLTANMLAEGGKGCALSWETGGLWAVDAELPRASAERLFAILTGKSMAGKKTKYTSVPK